MSPALEAALAWLDDHIDYEAIAAGRHPVPSLGRMQELCALMGDPQQTAPVIHVTGTNGKGSTVRMATALLAASGRLSPKVLDLVVPIYDPRVHYHQVRDTWVGVRTPDGK